MDGNKLFKLGYYEHSRYEPITLDHEKEHRQANPLEGVQEEVTSIEKQTYTINCKLSVQRGT